MLLIPCGLWILSLQLPPCAVKCSTTKPIADAASIDQVTAKHWVGILERLGIIFYLHPYSNNMLKRMVTKPKLYFYG